MNFKPFDSIIRGKKILVTGGTGSFGSMFVKTILQMGPKKVIVFSRDEDKQYSMQHDYESKIKVLKFIIGDIRDKESLAKAVMGVDICVHAAAMKQVPSSELNVLEVIKTNVLGAQNVIEACLSANVGKVLSISTDKAVEPINVYGMTKALQERIFTLANSYDWNRRTAFSSVRYGNVMGSRGSILRVFKNRIASDKPFLLTDRAMTRFTITLEEAIWLTLTALKDMVGGEIFVPDLKRLKLEDLVNAMFKVYGVKNKRIKIVGIRPGEKIHETLISQYESLRTLKKKGYYIVLPEINLNNIDKTYAYPKTGKMYSVTSAEGDFLSEVGIRALLKSEGLIKP